MKQLKKAEPKNWPRNQIMVCGLFLFDPKNDKLFTRMKFLYFDCFAGASGNMILGALIAAGLDAGILRNELAKLNIPQFELTVTREDRSGINGAYVDVIVPEQKVHRHLKDIEAIIDCSQLSDTVRTRSKAIFGRLAAAEARIHGTEIAKVHFHEVGALDAIVDIVGASIGFELLGIERFACSRIHVGSGFVNMAHGRFPVPPPAVTELLVNAPIYSTDIEGELMTPTGAAIISTVTDIYGPIPEMTVEHSGYGAGSRNYDGFPNVLRILIGESQEIVKKTYGQTEDLIEIETNLDDMSPQIIGYAMERAFELGALDCWFTPIQMKKDRPAIKFSVLCWPQEQSAITEMMFEETTTLGIRVRETRRECLEREIVTVETAFGKVAVKLGLRDGRVVNAMPEYDNVKRIASEMGIPFNVVRDAARAALEKGSAAGAN